MADMDTPLVRLAVTLQPGGGLLSPYHLFGVKNFFPAAFRRAAGCDNGKGGCMKGESCPCRLIFAQELSADPSLVRRHQKPSLPFVFQIPLLPGQAGTRGEVEAGLLLIGSAAVSHVEIFLQSLRHLFGAGPSFSLAGVRLRRVEALSLDNSRTLLGESSGRFDLSALPVAGFDELLASPAGDSSAITLRFTTPLRLMAAGRPLRMLPFPVLTGALSRRISSLASYYGGGELGLDYKWLAERSREIVCCGSDLEWANWGGGVQGVAGEVSYCGDLAEFLPLFRLGRLLHAGKGASYGMGRFEIQSLLPATSA